MADLIDRQAAIHEIHKQVWLAETAKTFLTEALNELPSAQPNLQQTCNQLATDYISRQAAYEALTDYYHHRTEIQHAALHEALNKVPSVQPEIIRCNDCKWWNHNTDLTYCDRFGTVWVGTDPDDFCSFAERETDE